MRRTPGGSHPGASPGGKHWKMALCSLSIGSSIAPEARACASNNGPAITKDSLLAIINR